MSRLAVLAYAVAAAVIAFDQASKAWVLSQLHSVGESIALLPFLRMTLVHNPGVSFGLLPGGAEGVRWGLVVFSTAVAIALAVWARRAERPLNAAALGLIIGGALGNVIDRVRFGVVTDFLDASALHFPWVFNVADSAISVGVAILLLESALAPKKA